MRKYAFLALMALALVSSANAQLAPTVASVRPVASVPDAGSTVALLGLSFALLALAQRKFAKGI